MINEQPSDISIALRSLKTIRKAERQSLSHQFVSGETPCRLEKTKEAIKSAIIDEISKTLDTMMESVSEDQGIGYAHEKLAHGHILTLVPLLTDGRLASDSEDARKSELTQEWKIEIYKRDGYKCINGCKSKNIHAHHKQSWKLYPEKRFDVNNGETLCAECHAKKHPEIANLIKSTKRGTKK
jgi:hypothetical protein